MTQSNRLRTPLVSTNSLCGRYCRISLKSWALLLIWASLTMAGCSDHQANPDQPCQDGGICDSGQSDAGHYFSVAADLTIAIQKEALSVEFLLTGNQVMQEATQNFGALKSRIVNFEERGASLFMLESSQGKVVDSIVPSTLILAEFPILKRDQGWIYFDFAQGMAALFSNADSFATDEQSSAYQPTTVTSQVVASFIDSAAIDSANGLALKLIAQLELPATSANKAGVSSINKNPTVAVLFNLAPYQPDPGFVPTLSPGQYQLGFFETYPVYQAGGKTTVRAVKFNLNKKPIPFAISANTPEDFRQAVKDGVLYWNTVFQEEVLSVLDAPEGVCAPDLNHNLVQWIDDQKSGAAYADFQADPRTGEILHAQIYMPSMWILTGRASAWNYLKWLEARDLATPETSEMNVVLRHFEPEPKCHLDVLKGMASLARNLLSSNATDDQFVLASQDLVRQVVAHEVGHTLGLRHNFAGSLGGDYQNYSRTDLLKEYLNTGLFPAGLTPTASIMDYGDAVDDLFIGSQVRAARTTASYDRQAIAYLYYGTWPQSDSLPVFCTDTDTDNFLDCRPGDYGKSPVHFCMAEIFRKLDPAFLTVQVLNAFISAKIPAEGQYPIEASQVYLNGGEAQAFFLLGARDELLKAFTAKGLYVRTFKREYPWKALGEVSQAEVRLKTIADFGKDVADYLTSAPAEIAAVSDLFFPIPADQLINSWQATFEGMLVDSRFTAGVGPDGTPYSFTPEELEVMKSKAAEYFEEMAQELVGYDVQIMGEGTFDLTALELGEGLLSALKKTTQEYLMKTFNGTTIEAQVSNGSSWITVQLPRFRYPFLIRHAVTGLLKKDRVEMPAQLLWGKDQRDESYDAFVTLLDGIFEVSTGKKFDEVEANLTDPDKNSTAAQQWYLENQYIKANYLAK